MSEGKRKVGITSIHRGVRRRRTSTGCLLTSLCGGDHGISCEKKSWFLVYWMTFSRKNLFFIWKASNRIPTQLQNIVNKTNNCTNIPWIHEEKNNTANWNTILKVVVKHISNMTENCYECLPTHICGGVGKLKGDACC